MFLTYWQLGSLLAGAALLSHAVTTLFIAVVTERRQARQSQINWLESRVANQAATIARFQQADKKRAIDKATAHLEELKRQ